MTLTETHFEFRHEEHLADYEELGFFPFVTYKYNRTSCATECGSLLVPRNLDPPSYTNPPPYTYQNPAPVSIDSTSREIGALSIQPVALTLRVRERPTRASNSWNRPGLCKSSISSIKAL